MYSHFLKKISMLYPYCTSHTIAYLPLFLEINNSRNDLTETDINICCNKMVLEQFVQRQFTFQNIKRTAKIHNVDHSYITLIMHVF